MKNYFPDIKKMVAPIALALMLAGCASTPSKVYTFDGKSPLVVHMLNEEDWQQECNSRGANPDVRVGFQWGCHIYLREWYCGQETMWEEMRHVKEGSFHRNEIDAAFHP